VIRLLVLAAALLGTALASGESAVFAELTHDFAASLPGEVREHTFRFRNPGPGTWTVRKAVTSCSCSVPTRLPATVAPMAELEVPVAFTLGPRRDGRAAGEIAILIEQDGIPGQLLCRFSTTIASRLLLPGEQGRLPAVELAVGEPPRSGRLPVRRGPHPAAWDRLEAVVVAGCEVITAAVHQTDRDSWELAWTVTPGALSGSIPGRIDLVCWRGGERLSADGRLVLPVRIAGPVQADPASLVFAALPLGMREERQVRLVDAQGRVVPALTWTASDPARCQAQPAADGATLVFQAVAPAGPASGWVDADTALGRVRIPYLAAVTHTPTP
jgi:hypothetical protein